MADKRSWFRRSRSAIPVTLALVGLASHIHFWYWPRARSATASGESLPVQLVLAPSEARLGVWLAYPHQNLGAVEGQLGGLDETLGSLADLIDLESIPLPRFGPFRFPPAHEMAVVIHDRGERLVLAVRFYPAVRWLLRAAGTVAGNRWLSGGKVTLGPRELEVSWWDGVWIARSKDLELAPRCSGEVPASTLALIRLGEGRGPVPAGLYRLAFDGRSLIAVSEPVSEAQRLLPDPWPELQVAALWLQFEEDGDRDSARGIVVLTGRVVPEPLAAVAVLHRGPGERWRLPGEGLVRVAGGEVQTRHSGDWSSFAFDAGALEVAEPVVTALREWDRQGVPRRLRGAAEVDLARATQGIGEVASMLERVPVLGPREARRWLALSGLLEALGEFDRLTVRIAASGRVEIRVEPGRAD